MVVLPVMSEATPEAHLNAHHPKTAPSIPNLKIIKIAEFLCDFAVLAQHLSRSCKISNILVGVGELYSMTTGVSYNVAGGKRIF